MTKVTDKPEVRPTTDPDIGTIPSELAILALLLEVARDNELCAPDSFWFDRRTRVGLTFTFRTLGEFEAWGAALYAKRETPTRFSNGMTPAHYGYRAEAENWNGYRITLTVSVDAADAVIVEPDASALIDDLAVTVGKATKPCPDCARRGVDRSITWSLPCRCGALAVTK